MNKLASYSGFGPKEDFDSRAIEFDHRITESKHIAQLQQENDHLRSLLTEAQALKNRNKEELISLREDKMDLELEVEELKDALMNQNHNVHEESQVKALKQRVELLEVTLGQLRQDKSVLINKLEEASRKTYTLETRTSKAENALKTAIEQQDHIRGTLADRNERLQLLSQEKSEESQKVLNLEADLKQALEKIKTYEHREKEFKQDVIERVPEVTEHMAGLLDSMTAQMEVFQTLMDQADVMGSQWGQLLEANEQCTHSMESLVKRQEEAAGRQQPAPQVSAAWHPVGVMLPEQSGVYLLTDGNRQCVGYFNSQAQSFSSTTLFESPTHWMKQPELPK